jgi:hypothetical protein
MTNRYENGKIYTIRSFKTDKFYIGSSCLELCKRLYKHRSNYKDYQRNNKRYITSFEILKYDDHYIELLEEYKCQNKMELEKREGELIRLHKDNIVNKIVIGRTMKEWKKNNKEHIQEYNKIKCKEYYQQNKDILKEKQTIVIKCKCGREIQKTGKARHERGIIHKKLINENDL